MYTSVPCMSWENAMNLYNENMHMFMTRCHAQNTLNRNAKVFTPAQSKQGNYIEDINNFCYNKQKVLNQLSK